MGLWIKNADGTIERTAGGGAVSGMFKRGL